MIVKVELFGSDLQVIADRFDRFEKKYTGLEIVSQTLMPPDDPNDGMGDLFNCEINIQSMNHFWALAKDVARVEMSQKTQNV